MSKLNTKVSPLLYFPYLCIFRSTTWNCEEIKNPSPLENITSCNTVNCHATNPHIFFQPKAFFPLHLSSLIKLFTKIFFFGFQIEDKNRVQSLKIRHVASTPKAFFLFTAVFKISTLWYMLCSINYLCYGFIIKSLPKPRSGSSLVLRVIKFGGSTKVKTAETFTVWSVFHTNYLCFHFLHSTTKFMILKWASSFCLLPTRIKS